MRWVACSPTLARSSPELRIIAPGGHPRFVVRPATRRSQRSRGGQRERLADMQVVFFGERLREHRPAARRGLARRRARAAAGSSSPGGIGCSTLRRRRDNPKPALYPNPESCRGTRRAGVRRAARARASRRRRDLKETVVCRLELPLRRHPEIGAGVHAADRGVEAPSGGSSAYPRTRPRRRRRPRRSPR